MKYSLHLVFTACVLFAVSLFLPSTLSAQTDITGFDPQAGPVSTVVIISGSGMDGATAVSINDLPCAYVSSSTKSIAVTVPPNATTGKFIVTTAAGPDTSAGIFTVTPNQFLSAPNGDSATTVQLAVGDIDNDGINDVVQLRVGLGKAPIERLDLQLVSTPRNAPGATPRATGITHLAAVDSLGGQASFALGDLNGDGRQDVVCIYRDNATGGAGGAGGAGGGNGGLSALVLFSDPANPGLFSSTYKLFSVTGQPTPVGEATKEHYRVAVGDVNGDGYPDIVCAVRGSADDSVYVCLNDAAGSGHFSPPIAIDEPGVHITDLCLARPYSSAPPAAPLDIFVLTTTGVDRLHNDGTGSSFSRMGSVVTLDGSASRLLVADVSGDGIPDICCLHGSTGSLDVVLGDNSGAFVSSASLSGSNPVSLSIAAIDVDGDNVPEIAIDEPGVQRAIQFVKVSDGSSSGLGVSLSSIHTGSDCDDNDPKAFAVGDLNGDGHPDVAVQSCSSSFTITPKITSFTPVSGPQGSVVTVSGVHLAGATSVSLGDVACPIVNQDDSNIVFNAKNSGHAVERIVVSFEEWKLSDIQPFSSTGNNFFPLAQIDSTVSDQILIGDLDGDGIPDMIQMKKYRRVILQQGRFGIGVGTPERPMVVSTCAVFDSSAPVQFAIGDLNRDGRADIIIAGKLGPANGGVEQSGAGSTTAMVRILFTDTTNPGACDRVDQYAKATGFTMTCPTVGDLDGDGFPDIAFVGSSSAGDSIYVWYNDAAHPGNFRTYQPVGVWGSTNKVYRLAFGPGGASGPPFIAAGTDSGVMALRKLPGRTSYASITLEAGICSWVGVGDYDGDGNPDIAAIEYSTGNVLVCWGNGSGFDSPLQVERVTSGHFENGDIPTQDDFDRDGRTDIILHEPGSPFACTVLRSAASGKSQISFGENRMIEGTNIKEDCDDGNDYKAVAVGDVDGDGIPDLVMGSCTTSTISPPLVTSMVPYTGPKGTMIRWTGTDFEGITAVGYLGTSLDIIQHDDTSITARTINSKLNLAGGTLTGSLRLSTGNGLSSFGPTTFAMTPNRLTLLPRVDSSSQRDVFLADVDGDGHPDAIECIVHSSSDGQSLLVSTSLGNGDGTFKTAETSELLPRLRVGAVPTAARVAIQTGDVDGDGHADLVVVSNFDDSSKTSLDIFHPDTTHPGTWLAEGKKGLNAVNVRKACLDVVDLNGDGRDDIILGGSSGGHDSIFVFMSTISGPGAFNPVKWQVASTLRKVHGLHRGANQIAPGFIVASDGGLDEYDSTDAGTFTVRWHVPPVKPIDDFVTGDLDGDGYPDIATFNRDSGEVDIYSREGVNPLYEGPEKVTVNPLYGDERMAAGDLDGDGLLDIVLSPTTSPTSDAIKGRAKRNYTENGRFRVESLGSISSHGFHTVALGDVNGDGFADMVFVSDSGNAVSTPQVVTSMSAVDFGSVLLGDSSSQTIKLSNVGGAAVTISSVSVVAGGTNGFSFQSGSGAPPVLVQPGSTTPLDIVFRPNHAKLVAGRLRILYGNDTLDIPLSATGVDTAMFRSFSTDSILTSIGDKGKPMTSIAPHPNVVQFLGSTKTESGNTKNLLLKFGSPVDLSRFVVSPPGGVVTSDTKFKTITVQFPTPLDNAVTVTISGVCTASKPVSISSYQWTHDAGIVIKHKAFPLTVNQPQLPMPNRINDIENALQNLGLLIGRSRADSSKQYGWLECKTSKDVLKSFFDKGDKPTAEQAARGFDQLSTGKAITGKQTSLSVTKFDDILLVDLMALKISIISSDLQLTPHGFGDLVFDDSTHSFLDGLSLRDLASAGDSMMMGRWDPVTKKKIFGSASSFSLLDSTIRRVNEAFEGPLDTVRFGGGLVWTGAKSVALVSSIIHRLDDRFATTKSISGIQSLPKEYALYQNYPNPFNPTTIITYSLKNTATVTLKVFNILGQEVATLVNNETMQAGTRQAQFNAMNYASGVYFYRIIAQEVDSRGIASGSQFVKVNKMLLVK